MFGRTRPSADRLTFRIGREPDGARRWTVFGRSSPIKDWKELAHFNSRIAAGAALAMMWIVEHTSSR